MTWQDWAGLFDALAPKLLTQWKCTLPPYDILPSEVLDAAVDTWCFELSKNLLADLQPPEIVQPWIVVRVICAGALAKQLAKQGDTDAPGLDGLTIRRLLVHEWREGLRDRWPLLLELDNE